MNMNDLFDGRFDRYFGTAHQDDPLWVFVHVPKTAGSSLNGELQPILSPNYHIYIDYAGLDPSEAAQSYEQLFDNAVDRFIQAAQARRYRFCTGHINAPQLLRIKETLPNVRPVTLLREPVARYVSDYRYQCSSMHPGNEEFRAAFPRIEDYLRLEGDWNKISSTLLPAHLREAADPDACVAWLLATYSFVGVQEQYDLGLHALSWCAGLPRRSRVRRRINSPTSENQVTLTPQLIAEIRERNMLDLAIFDAIAPRWNAAGAQLLAYLGRVAPLPPA